MAQKGCIFYRIQERTGIPSPTRSCGGLAPVLGDQLVSSAVSLQGVLGVEVLRQLGLAAHDRPVLLQVFLCLESQRQWRCYNEAIGG